MKDDEEHVKDVRERIREVTGEQGKRLVTAYYQPGRFAGALFDGYGENRPFEFTSDDFVAASLLDVRFGVQAVKEILVAGCANELLYGIPNEPSATLWNTPLDRNSAAWKLWKVLVGIDGIGPTRASKLLARKRPHLLPILDSVIKDHLNLRDVDEWKALGRALQDEELRAEIDKLGGGIAGDTPSTLRLLDVATWMKYSGSKNAERARKEALG